MSLNLPLKLDADPIIDAVIEIRLESSPSLSDVLPGVLLQALGDEIGSIDRLPAADLPKPVRDNDPNLIYQPLVRIVLGGYTILVGDRVLALACTIPYPGGAEFKKKAIDVFTRVLKLSIVKKVTRVSMKYVDFIVGDELNSVIPYLNFSMSIGNDTISENNSFGVRLEIPDNKFVHLVQVAAPVDVKVQSGPQQKGLLIEVDSIFPVKNLSVLEVEEGFSKLVDELHLANKDKFFALLTPYALNMLGAKYE